ncbi:MAG: hypothetical protein ACQEQZ_02460 [Pseudomonadota bacterium]
MRKGIFALLIAVSFSASAAAVQTQITKQDVAAEVSAQVTSISTELLKVTQATVVEALRDWNQEVFSNDSSVDAEQDEHKKQPR